MFANRLTKRMAEFFRGTGIEVGFAIIPHAGLGCASEQG
jgi:hypothetical protein